MAFRGRSETTQSLVPLADLLAGLVGIFLFVSIFTVLVASEATVSKVFPKEKSSDAKAVSILCDGDVVLLEDIRLAVDKFESEAADLLEGPRSYRDVEPWQARLESRTVETEFFLVSGDTVVAEIGNSKRVDLISAVVTTKTDALAAVRSSFSEIEVRNFLETLNPIDSFLYFIVRPDCVDTFLAARDVARSAGFQVGWSPNDGQTRISYTLYASSARGGGGIEQLPQ